MKYTAILITLLLFSCTSPTEQGVSAIPNTEPLADNHPFKVFENLISGSWTIDTAWANGEGFVQLL